MVVLPITGCAVVVVINPTGPVHTVFTVTGTPTAGLNSRVHVRVTADPTAMVLMVIVTAGGGTKGEYRSSQYLFCRGMIIGGDESYFQVTYRSNK